jgi:DNA helicase-2/ATP-dependent DNA helicase PcrA
MTFTRKASQEMRKRLIERLGSKAYHIEIGTMHSIALRMIHRFGELIKLKPEQVTVYNEFEESELLKDTAIDLAMYKGRAWAMPKKDIDAVFNKFYQSGEPPQEDHPAKDLFDSFFARCRENNSCTYGTLLSEFWRLIPELVKYLNWKHILVDEVQDIDEFQWAIINDLQTYFKASLFVVGDISQSIFEFRGAVPKYLYDHETEFDVYRLEYNYRSCKGIVDAANNVIRNNEMRLPLEMEATRPEHDGPSVRLIPDCNSEKLAEDAKVTAEAYDMEIDMRLNLTILARNHALLVKLSQLLTEKGVEHTYIGNKTKLVHSEAFVRFHAFLKLCVNPYDNFSFMMIQPVIGLSRAEYLDIRVKASQEGKSHFQVWLTTNLPFAQDFGNDIANFDKLASAMNVLDVTFGGGNETSAFVWNWILDRPDPTIQEYLDWLALYDIQDELAEVEEEAPAITLATIHAVKGLEWDTVVVAGLNEGILPSKQSINSGEIESERRLVYVAMTRAKNNLILTSRPVETESNGKVYSNPVSRFLEEI